MGVLGMYGNVWGVSGVFGPYSNNLTAGVGAVRLVEEFQGIKSFKFEFVELLTIVRTEQTNFQA